MRPGDRVLAVAVTPEVDAVTVGVVSMGGTVRDVIRRPTDGVPTAADTVTIAADAICDIQRTLREEQTVTAVGLAVPGLVHAPESTVQLAPNLDWHDVEIGQMFSAATELPVHAANDANAGAVAEHLFGNHHNAEHLIYVNGGPSGAERDVLARQSRALACWDPGRATTPLPHWDWVPRPETAWSRWGPRGW